MPTTIYKDIRDAIKDRIVANWVSPLPSLHWTNTVRNPSKSPWVQPRIIFDSAEAISLGPSGHNRIRGDIDTNIFAPIGTGDDEVMTWVDTWRGIFARGLLLPTATRAITFEVPEANDAIEDEEWLQVPVICPFYADEIP